MDDIDNLIRDNTALLSSRNSLINNKDEAPVFWPPRLPFDVALGESPERLCTIYDLTPEQLNTFYHTPAFRREVAQNEREISEHGITFKRKAALQAEMYLENIHDMVTDSSVAASVKLAAVQSLVKWGGLEPKDIKSDSATSNNVKIEICWMASPPSPKALVDDPAPPGGIIDL